MVPEATRQVSPLVQMPDDDEPAPVLAVPQQGWFFPPHAMHVPAEDDEQYEFGAVHTA